jgi:hypothetical protein
MTKIQNFGRGIAWLSTSDPTWQIQRGKNVTKSKGRGLKSAQSRSHIYMGQAQNSSTFIIFLCEIWFHYWAKPTLFGFLFSKWAFLYYCLSAALHGP